MVSGRDSSRSDSYSVSHSTECRIDGPNLEVFTWRQWVVLIVCAAGLRCAQNFELFYALWKMRTVYMKGLSFASLYSQHKTKFKSCLHPILFRSKAQQFTLHAAWCCWSIPAAACRRSPEHQWFICMEQLRSCQPHPSHQGNSRHLLSVSLALERLLLSTRLLPRCLWVRLSGATFHTGFLLPTLPQSQPISSAVSVLCLPSWFWSACSSVTRVPASLPYFFPLHPVEQTRFLLCNTFFSVCLLWVFHLLNVSSTFPCFCCKLHSSHSQHYLCLCCAAAVS